METYLYSVYDVQVEAFNNPFLARRDGEALRSVYQASLDPQTSLYQYPGDFCLFRIGKFDSDNGIVTPEVHKNLGTILVIQARVKKTTRSEMSVLDEDVVNTISEEEQNEMFKEG